MLVYQGLQHIVNFWSLNLRYSRTYNFTDPGLRTCHYKEMKGFSYLRAFILGIGPVFPIKVFIFPPKLAKQAGLHPVTTLLRALYHTRLRLV